MLNQATSTPFITFYHNFPLGERGGDGGGERGGDHPGSEVRLCLVVLHCIVYLSMA